MADSTTTTDSATPEQVDDSTRGSDGHRPEVRDRPDANGAAATRENGPADSLQRGHDADGDRDESEHRPPSGGAQTGLASRNEPFQRLSHERACGSMVLVPRMLTGNDRRIHLRQTVREDHSNRITSHDEEAEAKFAKLAGSLFSFFRGTALLFYRDMAGEDAWMPTVLAAGDVHPENFGVMPNADNVPIFGINDYDEAYYAPFTWDLKRGATGFMIAADAIAGYSRSRQRKIVRSFIRGYADRMVSYAAGDSDRHDELRQDNAPKMIAKLIADATSNGRATWLAKKNLDEHRRGFRASKKLVPVSSRRDEFQEVIERFVAANEIKVPERAAGMRVKDVAMRKGQGTASLGLTRYYLLIEGPNADGTDDVVLELKQARRSALAGLVPPSPYEVDGYGDRVAHAQRVQLVHGDVFYGSVDHEGLSFLVRERSPFRDDIDLDDLDKSEWREYAELCGGVVAHAHAGSDVAGRLDHDVEPAIVAAIGPTELFVDDIVRFADEAADRVKRDHEMYVADHALGAFRRVDVVYR